MDLGDSSVDGEVRFGIFFVGTIAWGVREGRPNSEGGTSPGCWVVEKDEESSRERKRKEHST